MTIEIPLTRPVMGREMSFNQWCLLREIDPSELAGEGEMAKYIFNTTCPHRRSAHERGKQFALKRRVERTNALYEEYGSEVPEQIVGYRELDLTRENDAAYFRAQKRRAMIKVEQKGM